MRKELKENLEKLKNGTTDEIIQVVEILGSLELSKDEQSELKELIENKPDFILDLDKFGLLETLGFDKEEIRNDVLKRRYLVDNYYEDNIDKFFIENYDRISAAPEKGNADDHLQTAMYYDNGFYIEDCPGYEYFGDSDQDKGYVTTVKVLDEKLKKELENLIERKFIEKHDKEFQEYVDNILCSITENGTLFVGIDTIKHYFESGNNIKTWYPFGSYSKDGKFASLETFDKDKYALLKYDKETGEYCRLDNEHSISEIEGVVSDRKFEDINRVVEEISEEMKHKSNENEHTKED